MKRRPTWEGIPVRKRIAEVSLRPLGITGVHSFAECLERSKGAWCRRQGCIIALLIARIRKAKPDR